MSAEFTDSGSLNSFLQFAYTPVYEYGWRPSLSGLAKIQSLSAPKMVVTFHDYNRFSRTFRFPLQLSVLTVRPHQTTV